MFVSWNVTVHYWSLPQDSSGMPEKERRMWTEISAKYWIKNIIVTANEHPLITAMFHIPLMIQICAYAFTVTQQSRTLAQMMYFALKNCVCFFILSFSSPKLVQYCSYHCDTISYCSHGTKPARVRGASGRCSQSYGLVPGSPARSTLLERKEKSHDCSVNGLEVALVFPRFCSTAMPKAFVPCLLHRTVLIQIL